MTRFYWMPLHAPDFFADTGFLTAEERGALIYIMLAVWRSPDGWIDDNAADLARFTATGENWRRIKKRISPLLTIENGRLTHRATQEARAKAAEISEQKRAAANARWRKNNGLAHANAYAKRMVNTDTDTDTEEEQEATSEDTLRRTREL